MKGTCIVAYNDVLHTFMLMGLQFVQASTTNSASPFSSVRSNTLGSRSSLLTSINLAPTLPWAEITTGTFLAGFLLGWVTLTYEAVKTRLRHSDNGR